jgi:hypothetical protein
MRKRRLVLAFSGMLHRDSAQTRFTEEIESHLQMHIEDNLRSGMTHARARREAVWKLGSVEATVQAYRERSTLPFFEDMTRDFHFALRQLHKNKGFTVTAILLLTLGLGASIAIFAFVDAALIKPLPFQNPNRLVGVFGQTALCPRCNVSYLNFQD